MAANPSGTERLALDREARAIQDEIERGHPHLLVFETRWAVTPLDLLRILRRLRPTVVHFAGHGGGRADEAPPPDGAPWRHVALPGGSRPSDRGLLIHGHDDHARFVSAEALTRAFDVVGSVRLVVLNACYSAGLAEALLPHVDCVVGMTGAISDEAARAFSIGFYGALADGAPVPAAYEHGKVAVGLEAWNGLVEAGRPQLKHRRDAVTLWAAPGPWRRMLDVIGMNLRLGMLATGALGVATACALLVVMIAIAWRAWFAFGESMLDVRVRQLVVRASEAPQPVQDIGAVRAVEGLVAAIEGAPPAAVAPGAHRVVLTGAFLSINYARAVHADPACQVRLAASEDGRVEIEHATPDGRACDHEVVVIAGEPGLGLAIDGASPVAVLPYARLALRMTPGTPVMLVAQRGRLSLFRPSDGVIWTASRLEGTSADGQRVRLPGGLRASDGFELTGSVELRELRLDDGQLAVTGALRGWSGRVGRTDDWDSAAPWPPSSCCGSAAVALVVLALAVLVRARLRWRAWDRELA